LFISSVFFRKQRNYNIKHSNNNIGAGAGAGVGDVLREERRFETVVQILGIFVFFQFPPEETIFVRLRSCQRNENTKN